MNNPALLSAREVAKYLGIPLKTLYSMNSNATGPQRIRVGRHVRYRTEDVQRWLNEQTVDGGIQ